MAGLVLKITLDKTEAQKALNEFAAQVATTLGKALPKSSGGGGGTSGGGGTGGGSGGGTGGTGGSQKSIKTTTIREIDELSKALEAANKKQEKFNNEQGRMSKQLVDIGKFEAFRSWFSDIRDVFDISTKSLLGFTDVQAQAASQAAYLAEKGITLGLAFGPLGAVIGGIAGAVLAMAHYFVQSNAEIEKLNATVSESNEEFQTWLSTAQDFQNLNLGQGVAAITKEFDALQKKVKESQGFLQWAEKNSISLNSWGVALGLTGNKYFDLFKQTEEFKNKTTELQQQQLSLNAQQWYSTALANEQALIKQTDLLIETQDRLGRQKTLSELAEDSKEARDGLDKARDSAAELGNKVALLQLKQKGKIFTEQDKKDLEEAQTLFDAATKSLSSWIGKFTQAKGAENAARDKSNADAKKARDDAYMESIKDNERMRKRDDERYQKQLEAQAKYLNESYKVNQYWRSREHALQVEWDAQILHSQLESQQKALDEEKAAREEHFAEVQTLAETSLGIASDFLSGFTSQLEENIAAEEKAFKNFGLVARQGVANVLKSLGKEWAARAIAEFAQGLAFLAVGDVASAGTAFAAGSTYGIAAAAAGVGGAVIGGRATAEANRRSAAEEERENKKKDKSRGGSGNGASGGGGRSVSTSMVSPIILNMNGNVFPTTNERDAATFGTSIINAIASAQRGSFDSTGMH